MDGYMVKARQIVVVAGEERKGQWLEGSLLTNGKKSYIAITYTENFGESEGTPYINEYQVFFDTICRCIGKRDMHENKIFEGDKIRYRENEHSEWEETFITYGDSIDYPAFDLIEHSFECNGLSYIFSNNYEIEVIGNIHDKKIKNTITQWF